MHHSPIKYSFNKAAEHYDNHCAIQLMAGEKLIQLLSDITPITNCIIDIGCGTGIVTEKLITAIAATEIHALDISDQLLQRAKQRLSAFNIIFHEMDFDHINESAQSFDIIFANLSLHWSNHLPTTIAAIIKAREKNGIFAFTIPLANTFAELHPYYAINQFYSRDEIISLLADQDLKPIVATEETVTLPFQSTLEALRSIKQVGANHVTHRTKKGLYGKNLLAKPINSLTYQLGFFII